MDTPQPLRPPAVPEKKTPRAVLQFGVELELRDHWADSNVAIARRVGCSGQMGSGTRCLVRARRTFFPLGALRRIVSAQATGKESACG